MGSLFGMDELTIKRGRIVVDLLCVGIVTLFFIYSLAIPLFGIIMGAVLLNIGASPQSKRVGRACLILGIISIAFYFLFLVMSLVIGTLPFLQGY